jgi:hypothetical protein
MQMMLNKTDNLQTGSHRDINQNTFADKVTTFQVPIKYIVLPKEIED